MSESDSSESGESGEDAAFVAIRAEEFVSGSKSVFDVFVRIAQGKYLKLLKAGDQFAPERLQTYLEKGVKFFYIPRQAQEEYLQYQQRIAGVLVKSEKFTNDVKTNQILGQGAEVVSFFQTQGVSEENIKYAQNFVTNVRDLVAQLIPAGAKDKDKTFAKFFENVAGHEHGVGTSLISGVLSHVVEIRMDKPVQIVGMASLFHDIGLMQLPEALWSEDESKMDEAQLTLYRTHPKLSADVLRKMRSVDPAAIQAVEQHHMRSNDRGFPSRGEGGMQTKVAEIVAVAEEFNRIIITRGGSQDGLLQELEQKLFPKFSRQIVYAFRTAFYPSKKSERRQT